MASRYKNLIYSSAEYTEIYNGFCGVELNGSSKTSSRARLAFAQNMYKNYDGDGADVIESIPGYRQFAHYGEKINAMYYQRSPFGNGDHLLVHVGERLMRHPVSDIYKKNAVGTEIARLTNAKSSGFEYGSRFYVMDTDKIVQISDDGTCKTVSEDDAPPYVPTTYVNGEEFEQRNLLTRNFKEEFYVADPKSHLFSSHGLKYTIIDPAERYCSLCGIEGNDQSKLYIPSYVDIAGVEYKVISVEASAFSKNNSIKLIHLAEGIIRIYQYAFSKCSALQTLILPDTLSDIDEYAFADCTQLKTIYFGESIGFIAENAFVNCGAITDIYYALGAEEFFNVSTHHELNAANIRYRSHYEKINLFFPFHDQVDEVTAVTVNGQSVEFNVSEYKEKITGVSIIFQNSEEATDVKIIASGLLTPLDTGWLDNMTVLNNTTPYDAVVNCSIAEVFDGRIFFSGNPDMPNTVFYTERADQNHDGALYVGRYNYFNDGVGSRKVNGLLSVRDMLAVFKEKDDGAGSIFYHKKEGVDLGAIDTIYPVAYVHSGLSSTGDCISFLDDPVFLTEEGLMALNKENIYYQRNVVSRSHNVNYYLLKEDLSKASLCEWLGYLAVGVNGKVFLADSRSLFVHTSGSREYDWFYLSDIGAYNDDKTVYRYSADDHPSAPAHPTMAGEKADGSTVYSAKDENGEMFYYSVEDNERYHVFPTAERDGGTFYPATLFISHERLLFFATDDGHICVFNNDLKGIAPDEIKASSDYDEQTYASTMGDRIHPLFYSFAGHAPRYSAMTTLDDCGIPHLTKSTVKKSLVIKAKSEVPDSIICEVKTDGNDAVTVAKFPAGETGFDEFDFSLSPWYKSRYVSTALPENEKRWIEKQIAITSDSFASPISLYSIAYRYTIKGKIKNNI